MTPEGPHQAAPVPRIGVACLVVRDGKLLLMRRRGSHGAGTWCPPGGHLDYGESVSECAAREAAEETGLAVSNLRFVGVTQDLFPEADKHYVTLWMAADAPDGDPVVAAPEEMDQVGWFDPAELPRPLFLSLENFLERPLVRAADALPGLRGHP